MFTFEYRSFFSNKTCPIKLSNPKEVQVPPVTSISPATPSQNEQQEVEVKPSCLTCSFECNFESELDTHMESVHRVPKPNPQAIHPNGSPCQDCQTKEKVIMDHIQKIECLELNNCNRLYTFSLNDDLIVRIMIVTYLV